MASYRKSKERYPLDPLTVPNIDIQLAMPSSGGLDLAFDPSGLQFPNTLENDADINKLEHELLRVVQSCIPLALTTYSSDPKKPNADSLNTFISQSREIAHDIRNLQDKKRQTERVLNDCLKPSIMKIYNHFLSLKEHQEETLSMPLQDYDNQVKTFLTLIMQEIQAKLEDIY